MQSTEEKKNKLAPMVLLVSPKVGMDSNCPLLNVYDVPWVRKINRFNLPTNKLDNLNYKLKNMLTNVKEKK